MIPKRPSTSLNGGEIAGVVIGALLLVALFAGGLYVLARPPDRIRPYLYPGSTAPGDGGSGDGAGSRSSTIGFDNPMAQVDMAEIEIG